MSATAGGAGTPHGVADKLGITAGMVVQELGWDEDCDDEFRQTHRDLRRLGAGRRGLRRCRRCRGLWWREGDGDLVDALVDALTPLADHGVIWLLTPKAGREGHVEPSDVSEAAPTAGLQQTSSISAAQDWNGARLVAPKAARGKGR